MAQFTMRRGPEPGKVYTLTEETVQIGRGVRNDIVIIDNEVSREHCRLIRTEDGYEIFDLESSNGTFVNGQRVKHSWLLPAECIVEFGDSITLEYRHQQEDDDATQHVLFDTSEYLSEMPPSFLVVIANTQPIPAVYPLEGEIVDVGRGTTNNVIIVEPEISRHHLRLTLSRYGYVIQDLGSTNGTSLNGVELNEPTLLHDGDVIRIGTTIVIRYTTNPQMFMSKKSTAHLHEGDDHTKEPTRNRRTLAATAISPLHAKDHTPEPSSVGPGIEPGSLFDHVLLIYDRNDWEYAVAPIVDRLYSVDIPVWVEQYLAPGGDDWTVAIEQARLECWLLIVVVSHNAMDIDYIQRIWRYFHNREKPVILVMQEEIEHLPIVANNARKITYYAEQPELSLQQIVQAIRQIR